jgi:glycosyltransferase involved in cell wall biosynthesis
MNQITLVMAYYENPLMLDIQYDYMRDLSLDVIQNLSVVIVDDGSPRNPAEVGIKWFPIQPSLQIFRMGVDIRWNQDACRNIGVKHAETDWVLLTDMDHLVPNETWRECMNAKLDPACVYMFPRVSAPDMSPYKHHPNTWLMTRKLYDRVGGYDERFAGIYGTDGDFASRIREVAKIKWRENPVIRVPSTEVADAATTAYKRKTPEDHAGRSRVRAERAAIPNWRPLRYRFPYSRVYPR